MEKKKIKIAILGGGISALTAAFQLEKSGYSAVIFEQNSEPGGSMITRNEEGYLLDFGPNSGLETTPLIAEIVNEIGMADEMVYANEKGNKRYILKNGKLIPLPMSPAAFFKTPLFSARAKFRLLAEPFIKRSHDGYYQSIADFVRRRLGTEFLDYAINPFVSGVFAGDPEKLSVKSAFPKLYALEENYGGLIKGTLMGARERKKRKEVAKQSAKMFSFRNGMQSMAKRLAEYLSSEIKTGAEIEYVRKSEEKFEIIYRKDGESASEFFDLIISAIPAYDAGRIFQFGDEDFNHHCSQVYYPPVAVLYLGFRKNRIAQPLDGFGFLIPTKEKKDFLGAIWSSVLFENRAPEDYESFTLFIGGAQKPEILDQDDENLIANTVAEFKKIMKIDSDPEFVKIRRWEKAIPQYNLGYIEHERYFESFEHNNPGVFLSGNFRGGISVGDCFKNSSLTASRVLEYINKISKPTEN